MGMNFTAYSPVEMVYKGRGHLLTLQSSLLRRRRGAPEASFGVRSGIPMSIFSIRSAWATSVGAAEDFHHSSLVGSPASKCSGGASSQVLPAIPVGF
eukprot:scaffold650_cov249-Pinguiococcus_pyrenoidosus.AAC.4